VYVVSSLFLSFSLSLTLCVCVCACRHIHTHTYTHKHINQVDAKSLEGESPGHIALKNGHLQTLELLLNAGLNIEARDNNGETLLHYAARTEGLASIELLCQRGAHLQAKNNSGWCALHIAADVGNLEAIRCLILHGCDIDVRDKDGGSWLFLLHKTHYSEVTKFLVAANTRSETHADGPRMVLRDSALVYTQEPEEPIKNLSCERHFSMIKFVSQIAAGNEFDPHSKVCCDWLYVRVCVCVCMYPIRRKVMIDCMHVCVCVCVCMSRRLWVEMSLIPIRRYCHSHNN
jgi:hypothetical protein